MFTKNLIITFLSLVVGILTYFKFNSDGDIQENYINYPFQAKPQRINLNKSTGDGHAACGAGYGSSAMYSLPTGGNTGLSYNTAPTKYSQPQKEHYRQRGMTKGVNHGSEYYTVPGTYQANLSPRIMSQGFGGNINYNAPAQKNMALRANDPMMLANSIEKPTLRENYTYSADSVPAMAAQARKGSAGNFMDTDLPSPSLPSQTMSNFVDLSQDNVITYDRYMWSTSYDRNAAQGDFIRGDIPIIPNADSHSSWFTTHQQHNPSASSQVGAMAVMGGQTNATSQQTASLVMQSLGGSSNTLGGIVQALPPSTAVSQLLGVNQGASYTMASANGGVAELAAQGVATTAFP